MPPFLWRSFTSVTGFQMLSTGILWKFREGSIHRVNRTVRENYFPVSFLRLRDGNDVPTVT
jgi:hypothetical protein